MERKSFEEGEKMLTEQLISKVIIYFTGIMVSIGLVLKMFLIIEIGIIPSLLIAVYWALKSITYSRTLKGGVFINNLTFNWV